jgi:flagellar basal-body rod protein FlgC
MSLFSIFDVSSSAMAAQTLRLNATASNMANADSVATKPEDAYKAREPVFSQVLEQNGGGVGVRALGITQSNAPNPALYQPGNPLANKEGYVYTSNVNPVEEMVNMLSASRSYQTNVQVMDTAKNLALRTLQLGQ